MPTTNVSSTWTNGNLVFSGNGYGNGTVVFDCVTMANSQDFPVTKMTALTTAANYTMTVPQLLGGLILDTPTVNSNAALPTPANVAAAIPGFYNGTTINLIYRNNAASAQSITLQTDAGSGWTMIGNCNVMSNYSKQFILIISNATNGNCIALGAVATAT